MAQPDAPPALVDRPWLTEPSLALRERLARAPAGGCVKGWLFQSLIDRAKAHGVTLAGVTRRIGFKDYPVGEYLEALGQAAMLVQPDLPPLATLRLLGQGVYGSFKESLLGKVVIAGLGTGHDGARSGLKWVTRVYQLTSNHARAEITEPNDEIAIVELSNVWSFPDAYHVGIFEGAARGFGGGVDIQVESRTLSSARLIFRWTDGDGRT